MHFPHTPESLLARSDSKNPASTCRGLTLDGRPCRRPLSKSPTPTPGSRRPSDQEGFCWQHQEQATPYASPAPKSRRRQGEGIKEKNSVDSLVGRLGISEIEDKDKGNRTRRKPVAGGFVYDPDVPLQSIEHSPPRRPKERSRQREKQSGLLCCFGAADAGSRAPRPVKSQPARKETARLPAGKQKPSHLHPPSDVHRPSIHRDPSSRTGEFLALIPPSASPQLTAQLLAELAKPASDADEEGYIYMFWLTPESLPADTPSETASTLLAPPSTQTARGQRRTSEILKTFASSTTPGTPSSKAGGQQKMLLKIGRAQNVHRRLNQWSKQCDYNLSLIRYYPYHQRDGNASNLPSTPPRKVPMATKVERLIHIELADKRAKGEGKCEKCGREHREWFELDASREGVKSVDEVIRRWVGWAERESERR